MPVSVSALDAQTSVRRFIRRCARLDCGVCRVLVAALVFWTVAPVARSAKWDPVNLADLAAKDSKAFPGTEVEILLSQHLIEETGARDNPLALESETALITENFMRAKVYTAKGVEDLGRFPITYHSSRTILEKAARVVKPDGSGIELKKSDIFESVLARTRKDGDRKQITFVFPGLEPGDVVEYRWTERIERELWLETFFCQETIPVREYRFKVGNLSGRGSVGWLNCPPAETNTQDGFELTFHNLPVFEEEEHMPPQLEFRGWVYVTKTFPSYPTDRDIWKVLSVEWADSFKRNTRPSGEIKEKAETLVVGATTDEEKLSRLYAFCQAEIFNTTYRTTAAWQAEIQKHEGESADSAARTLERGRGRRDEVNLLFASLVRVLGYDTRLAYNASRNLISNVMIPRGWAFIDSTQSVAVKVGKAWRYFNPGCYIMPYGLMASDDEGATTLLCDTRKLEYGTVGFSNAADSQVRRTGRFVLDTEGTLAGTVEEVFSGHLATTRKASTWGLSLDEATEGFRKEITKRLPHAEVTAIAWTNLESQLMPLTVRYQVRVPGYAERVGKRLVFAPAIFESGSPALFAAAERKYPILFPSPWAEHDDVEIVLPEGYVMDKPSAPAPVGDVKGAFGVAYKLQYSGKTRTFGLQRDFALGANGAFFFQRESYPTLKNLATLLQKSDTHSIVLKPQEVMATAPAAAPSAPAAALP